MVAETRSPKNLLLSVSPLRIARSHRRPSPCSTALSAC